MSPQRQLNIELLRIVSMLLICFWHVNGHFLSQVPAESNNVSGIMAYVGLFINFHVDLFVLITGYFGIRHRTNGFVKTILLSVFYALLLNAICSTIGGGKFHFAEILLPISSSPWWFLKVYIVLLLLAPVAEKYIEHSSKREFYILLGISTFINIYLGFFMQQDLYYSHGYDIFNFMNLYLIGMWIRKSDIVVEKLKTNIWVCVAIFILCCVVRYKVQPITSLSWTDYNSPLCILMAVSVFIMFMKLKINDSVSKSIMFLSSSAVSVYLITDYTGVRDLLLPYFSKGMAYTNNSCIFQITYIMFVVVFAFIACCIIDKVRIVITTPISNRLIKLLK